MALPEAFKNKPRTRTDITAEEELAGLVAWLDTEVAPHMERLELVAKSARELIDLMQTNQETTAVLAQVAKLITALHNAGRLIERN